MNNSSKRNFKPIVRSMLTIFIVVLSLMCSEALQQNGLTLHVKATIQNNNDYLLGVHCKSGDKDIGYKILKKGEIYDWEFGVFQFSRTALFFCGFGQGKIKKGVFDIYIAPRDYDRCKHNCTWIAENDGIYGYSEPPQATLYFKWLK